MAVAAQSATIQVGNYDSSSAAPFGEPSGSGPFTYPGDFQQLYDHSLFGGPMTITSLAFATPSQLAGAASSPEILTLTIDLSTTSATVATISNSPAANLGTDNTQVYSGTVRYTPGYSGLFDLQFATSPFTYNPANGNLLMTVDIQSSSGSTQASFEASFNAAFARVFYNFANRGDTAQGGYGLVTQFGVADTPTAPEPGSWWLAGLGLSGLGALLAVHKGRSARLGQAVNK